MIRCKQAFLYLSLTALLTTLIINIFFLHYLRQHKATNTRDNNSNNIFNDFRRVYNSNLNESIFYYFPNKWMINNQIFQYSSYILIKNNKPYHVVSLLMIKIAVDFKLLELKCLIKSIKTGRIYKFDIVNTVDFVGAIKQVKCLIDVDMEDLNDLLVAIINNDDFKVESDEDQISKELGKSYYTLPESLINFQIPTKVFVPNKKFPEIAICVHYSYGIPLNKILKWLQYHHKIGIKKIVLYNLYDLDETKIHEKFDKSFVDIRPYNIDYEALCDSKRLKSIYEKLGKVKYQIMKDECEEVFYRFFDNPFYDHLNRWNHELVTSNDCYSSLQPIYDFVAYYDYDEIIHPRSLNASKTLECTTHEICDLQQKIDIYSYLNRLIMKNHVSRNLLSSFEFKNVYFIESNYYLKTFMQNLNEFIIKNETYFHNESSAVVTALNLHLKLSHTNGYHFLVYPKDLKYIKQLHANYVEMECLNKKININETMYFTFNRFIFIDTEKHSHKFVHNTANVNAVYPYYQDFSTPGSKLLAVDVNDGMLSHFRNDYFELKELTLSITCLKFDLEYFKYFQPC